MRLYFDKLKDWLNEHNIPWKLVLYIFVFFTGSSISGIASEYAAYSYAINLSFRPPVDGVPYLQPTVAALSFIFSIITIAAIAFLLLFMYPLERSRPSNRIKKNRPAQVYILVAFVFAAAGYGVGFLFSYLAQLPLFGTDNSNSTSYYAVRGYLLTGLPYFVSVLYLVAAMLRYFPIYRFPILLILSCSFFLSMILVQFYTPFYSGLLQVLKYGGGIETELMVYKDDGGICTNRLKGGLMLRTNEAVIIYLPEVSQYVELPKEQVCSIQHPAKFKVVQYDGS